MQHVMSSNMAIPKICSYCGKTYIAKTTMTRYCSLKCNSRHYKQKVKDDKIQLSLLQQQQTMQSLQTSQTANPDSLSNKGYLCVQDAAELIGVSRWTINRMIKRGELQIHKFGRKKIIERSQIDKLFN
ncbi:excisionase family DNA binding protein [Flavobacterium sp. CG_9.10]|uniref:helix-turn-helix domain-containing protein n=1 Tax=Flavobacterium sp. CG_9.10 TaxID=2787729 RepID=UPI0018C938A5|nr:helix-turn-helix domain-containing protein [Flavobacterium sp. CG_9.10]MBG6111688.1 excisionase family DNA binding protein [Flavobacterium sp. CG_9.10]